MRRMAFNSADAYGAPIRIINDVNEKTGEVVFLAKYYIESYDDNSNHIGRFDVMRR